MLKKIAAFLLFFILTPQASFAYTLFENEQYLLSLDIYARFDTVAFKNAAGLDRRIKDDSSVYLGLDYSAGFTYGAKDDRQKFYLKLERNGPFDYDAPIFVHNTLMTSDARIERYRNEELLPNIEEAWLDRRVGSKFGVKAGLYAYDVGNGFSLNGGYENLGVTIYRHAEDFCWRLYYCRPDISHRERLGPRISQEEDQALRYEHNAANFFATDLRWGSQKSFIQPYAGVLADYTSAGKRDNTFTAPIRSDILGTLGLAWNITKGNLAVKTEVARNFGQAKSADPLFKDVEHTGFLAYSGIEYTVGKFKPAGQMLAASGNKVTPESALSADETLLSGKNRAFSYFSPLNMNLGDSISSLNCDAIPIVAMGMGYGLNYGVPRPGNFYSGDFENILAPSLGFDYNFTPALCLGVYQYYLRSFERPVGTYNGEGKYLSNELGYETDVFLDYTANDHLTISFLGGYFLPGKYYKELRDDTAGSLMSPFVRGDGKADGAYQLELAVEFKY